MPCTVAFGPDVKEALSFMSVMEFHKFRQSISIARGLTFIHGKFDPEHFYNELSSKSICLRSCSGIITFASCRRVIYFDNCRRK